MKNNQLLQPIMFPQKYKFFSLLPLGQKFFFAKEIFLFLSFLPLFVGIGAYIYKMTFFFTLFVSTLLLCQTTKKRRNKKAMHPFHHATLYTTCGKKKKDPKGLDISHPIFFLNFDLEMKGIRKGEMLH